MTDERTGGGTAPAPAPQMMVDPTWEEIVERDPLVAFSWYLSGRASVLRSVAAEIVEYLDRGFSATVVDFAHVDRAESLMWLWTLGAYEIIRTMCQAKACFSARALTDLSQLKKTLSAVRMPAAKMEKPGKSIPVTSNRSPSGLDYPNRDLLVNDPDATPNVSARFLLGEFTRVISAIEPCDVLQSHEAAYGKQDNSSATVASDD